MVQAGYSPAPAGWHGLAAAQARRCGLVAAFSCACATGLAASERMQPLLVEFGREGGGAVLGIWQAMAAGAAVSALAVSLLGAYGAAGRGRPDRRRGPLDTAAELAGAISAAGSAGLGALLAGVALAGVHGLADIPMAVSACLSTLLTALGLGLLAEILGPDRRRMTLLHIYGLGLTAKLRVFVVPVLLFGTSLACLWSGAPPAWTGTLLALGAVTPLSALLASPARTADEQLQLTEFHAGNDLSSPGPRILQ